MKQMDQYWVEKCSKNGKEVKLLNPTGFICDADLAKKYEETRNYCYALEGGSGLTWYMSEITAREFRKMKELDMFGTTLEHAWEIEEEIEYELGRAEAYAQEYPNRAKTKIRKR